MLKDFVKAAKPDEEQITKEVKQAREKLAVYQMKIKEAKLPVMVIFEGWGSAGKGSVIGRVIRSPVFSLSKQWEIHHLRICAIHSCTAI